jgi:hypothetical protein
MSLFRLRAQDSSSPCHRAHFVSQVEALQAELELLTEKCAKEKEQLNAYLLTSIDELMNHKVPSPPKPAYIIYFSLLRATAGIHTRRSGHSEDPLQRGLPERPLLLTVYIS